MRCLVLVVPINFAPCVGMDLDESQRTDLNRRDSLDSQLRGRVGR